MSVEVSEEERGGPSSGAPKSTPPIYPDHCPEHADVAVPGNCGPCADTRKANQARPRLALVESPTQKCLIHMEADVDHCRGCAADRKAAESA